MREVREAATHSQKEREGERLRGEREREQAAALSLGVGGFAFFRMPCSTFPHIALSLPPPPRLQQQSPYIGRKTDANSVLYQQYTSLESVILEKKGAEGKSIVSAKSVAAAAAAAPPPASTPPALAADAIEQTATPAKKAPKRPKKREREAAAAAAAAAVAAAAAAAPAATLAEAPPAAAAATPAVAAAAAPVAKEAAVAEAAPAAAAEGAEGEGAKRKRRRKRGKGGLGNGTAPSGPGNAEEAARIRDALGFADATKQKEEKKKKEKGEEGEAAAAAASAPAAASMPADLIAAAPPATTSSFQFEFSELENDAVPVEREAVPEEAAKAIAAAAGPSTAATPANGDNAADAAPKRRARGGVKTHKRDGDSSRPSSSSGSQDPLARRVFVGGMPFKYEEAEVREYWSWCGEIEAMSLLRFPDTGRFRGIAFITFADDEGYAKALECDGAMLEGVRVKVERCKVGARGEVGAGAEGAGGAGGGAAAEGKAAKPAFDAPAPKTPGYSVAYVGNVAFEASAEDVAALFNEALAPGAGEAGGTGGEEAAAAASAGAGGGDSEPPPSSLPLPPPPPRSAVTRVRLHTDKVTGKSRGYAHVHFLTEEQLDRAVREVDGAVLCGRAVRVGFAQPKKE